jgi:hypothetical protein
MAATLPNVLAVPSAGARPAQVASPLCHVSLTVTSGDDGLRDDSGVIVRLGGQRLQFEDHDGDFVQDVGPLDDVHRGGTGDRARASYVWDGRFDPCVARSALADGWTIQHEPPIFPDPADDWDLRALHITDLDTGEVLFHSGLYGDPHLAIHQFGGLDESLDTSDLPSTTRRRCPAWRGAGRDQRHRRC